MGARADLAGIDLVGADLQGVDLSAALLRGAVLRGADLAGALLAMADLSLVDGRYARMEGADLRGARLDRAIFAGAMMSEVLASPMPIRGRADWPTNLTSTRLTAVCLAGADLNRARTRASRSEQGRSTLRQPVRRVALRGGVDGGGSEQCQVGGGGFDRVCRFTGAMT